MRLLPSMLTAAVMVVWAIPATGQPVLTLDQAVADALAANPGLAAVRQGSAEAAARQDEARSRLFPRVTVSEAWQRGNAPVFVFSSLLAARQFQQGNFAVSALNRPDPVGFFHGAVSVEQTLFDGGRTGAGVDASRALAAMADAEGDEAALGLAVQVAATYGRVLMADVAGRAAEAAVAAAVEDVARAERRRDAGTVTEADVLSLRVHLAAMQQRRIEAGGQLAVARAELNRLRGVPVDTEFAAQEPPPPAPGGPRDWQALADEAVAARPELQRAAAAVSVGDAARRQARSAWRPQVAAQATYQYDGLSFADRASAWMVGGEARWSLSTGLGDRAAQRAAVAAAERARLAHDDARAAVRVDVLSAVRQIESAEARDLVARATVTQARESQRIVRDRYEAGLASAHDVLAAAAAVLDAETSRVTVVAERLTAQAALDRAIGRRP